MRFRSKRLVIWLRVVAPQDGTGAEDELFQLRVRFPVAGQHLFHQSLVTGVGERVVAAKRMIFAACHAIHAVATRRRYGMCRFSRHF